MKKIKTLLWLFLICILLCGCGKEHNDKSKQDTKKNINKDVKNDINKELYKKWLFFDSVRGEYQILRLNKDGSFSYSCECGEGVDDFDVYDRYTYDKNKQQLIVSNDDKKNDKYIDILSMNEYHLMLRINDKIKDFIIEEEKVTSNFYSYEGDKYLSGYNSKCSVVDIKGDKVTYGPINYDPEGLYKDGPFETYKLAKKAKFYEVSVQSYNSIQGDSEYEEFYEVEQKEIPTKDIEKFMEYGMHYSYVWFDKNLDIKKIVFFGHTEVTADYKTITIPAEHSKDITKARIEKEIEEGLYEAAHINEEGSVLYLMLEEQKDKFIKEKKYK